MCTSHTHGCPGYTRNGVQHPCKTEFWTLCYGRNAADPGDVPVCEYEAEGDLFQCEDCFQEQRIEDDRLEREDYERRAHAEWDAIAEMDPSAAVALMWKGGQR